MRDVMSDYWVNFAYTGDPNGENLPRWHSFAEADEPCMIFNEKIEERLAFDKRLQDLLYTHQVRR